MRNCTQKKFTKTRLELWRNQDMEAIIACIRRTVGQTTFRIDGDGGSNVDIANIRNCLKKAAEGNLGDAVKALLSAGVLEVGPRVIEELRVKHPVGVPPLKGTKIKAFKITAERVVAVFGSFKPGTACGPSGERVEFILDCLRVTPNGEFLDTLVRFFNLFLDGKFPDELSPYYGSGNAIPLCKNETGGALPGVRPIVVGDVMRRACGKACVAEAKPGCSAHLEACSQYGVGVPKGSELIVHATAECVERLQGQTGLTCLQVDFSNAFNRVSREAIFKAVREHCSKISAFVEWIYSTEAHLVLKGAQGLTSSQGVQQGDPLGPLLFSLVLAELVSRIKVLLPDLDLNAWFLDDGVLIGKSEDIKKVYEFLVSEGPAYGLHLNPKKCVLFWPNVDCGSYWSEFPPELRRTSEGIKLLGSPIGSHAFIRESVSKTILSIRKILDSVAELGDPQTEALLIRACVGFPKIVFHMRCNAASVISEELDEFDRLVDTALMRIIGKNLSADERQLASLPIRSGGYGFLIATKQADSAFVASVLGSWSAQQKMGCKEPRSEFNIAMDHLKNSLPDLPAFDLNDPTNITQFTQCQLNSKLNEISFNDLYERSDVRTKALMKGRSMIHANGWLTGAPNPWIGHKIGASEFRYLLKYHLGIPCLRRVRYCRHCEKEMDCFGDHAISCGATNQRIRKHNMLVRAIEANFKGSDVETKKELMIDQELNQSRPGDLVIYEWYASTHEDMWVDVSVVSALSPSYVKLNENSGGNAAHARNEQKIRHYENAFAAYALNHPYDRKKRFQPIAIESTGGYDPNTYHVLRDFAARSGLSTTLNFSKCMSRLMVDLSFRLQKMNGHMLSDRCGY